MVLLQSKGVSDSPIYVYNLLTYVGVSRTHLEKLPTGKIVSRPTTGIPFIIYVIIHLNSLAKGLFLLGLFAGLWEFEMEFFDYIAGMLWFLIFCETCIGDWLLMRRYPYFEILMAGFRIQDEIHQKLGPRMEEFRQKQDLSIKKKAWFQWIIILMGISACILQYASAPKYCIFTNALIEADTPLVNWLMGFHDVGFIAHAWLLYGSDVCVQSVFGGQFQHCLKVLAEEVRSLAQELDQSPSEMAATVLVRGNSSGSTVVGGILNSGRLKRGPADEIQEIVLFSESKVFTTSQKESEKKSKGPIDVANLYPKYTFEQVILDYRKLGIFAERMNDCCSYNFLVMHVISYVQMTSDVFVIFQLLRTPGSSPSDVAYFIEDCIVCMFLLYKCFKAISFVGAAADEFLDAVERYSTKADPRRKYNRKVRKSLPKIVMKLGPSICTPSTVGNACMILMNYYIMVALW